MADRRWVDYSPKWAPTVHGRYEAREYGPGGPEPQKVEMRCDLCGASWQTTCDSGMVRGWIDRFASQHVGDAFGPRGKGHGHAGA